MELEAYPGHPGEPRRRRLIRTSADQSASRLTAITPRKKPQAEIPRASPQGYPWENGYVESFNARFRDELLNGEIFYSLREAEIIIESWRRHYNAVRPHASLGYRPPAPEVMVPTYAAWPAALTRPAPPARLHVAPKPTVH